MNKFKLIEIKPRIFFLDFKKKYDCCMTFLRYQEYYESPNSKFRGKQFEIVDFMEWYSNKYGNGAFTYAIDWSGFNLPGAVIDQVSRNGITDYNKYDAIMENIYEKGLDKYSDGRFYVIGAVGQSFAMKHEIAHGLFYINSEYRKKMKTLVAALKPSFRNKIYKTLSNVGYTPKVYIDECQAYLATGFTNAFGIKLKGEHKPFIKLYKEYYDV